MVRAVEKADSENSLPAKIATLRQNQGKRMGRATPNVSRTACMQIHRLLSAVVVSASVLSVLTVMLATSLLAQARALRDVYREDVSISEMIDLDDEGQTDRVKRAA